MEAIPTTHLVIRRRKSSALYVISGGLINAVTVVNIVVLRFSLRPPISSGPKNGEQPSHFPKKVSHSSVLLLWFEPSRTVGVDVDVDVDGSLRGLSSYHGFYPCLMIHDSKNSRSSRVSVEIIRLSALRMASAKSRFFFCSSNIFSSTVPRQIRR